MGNHTPGHNHESISVCLIGGLDDTGSVDEQSFTAEQDDTLAFLIAMARAQWPDIRIVHRYELQRRKGDTGRRSLCPNRIDRAIKRSYDFAEAKPIMEVIKLRPPKPKDIIRDNTLYPA